MSDRPRPVPLVDLAGQYAALREEVLTALERILDSGRFIHADVIGEFEQAFATFCGVRHAVAVNSGTAALHLALLASGVGPGDEVITVPNSFVATAAAICHAGARPVFVDVDPQTATMDPAGVEAALTTRTRALLPVHLYGHPAPMDELRTLATRHGLLLIEDACQAHGAEYLGRRAGSLGDAACFSFYPGKNLGGYGEGGMVVTDRPDIAEQVRLLRDHGAREKYRHDLIGFNERLDALQAAILLVKLPYLAGWTAARRDRAALYDELLA
ncbi:MAG: DegT/DnrJ/EryC1/StrS family aminotransferase, partial [Deltaproteobacteria bacterium]|nr:DegT/DnrJ/EryC1/StrS family aminotransferase [Deltaproteobacteria bacterium]